MPQVRTRFAPSPTGYMHIGGMRTALFNWLWARHNGGQFILRIDDTDQSRNMEEALGPILEAFRWLGLDWDEGPEVGGPHGPYFQSERTALYQAACDQLIRQGLAYRDYDPPELTQQDREAAEKEKRPFLNIRRSLELSEAQLAEYRAENRPYVIRFLVNREEKVHINDHVRGHVEWDCGLFPDPVIMRGDGTALYNFATVVDDAALEITHVIRAEEHLSNTPIQVLLFQALGYDLPEFAHIPFVAAPGTKEKLSKREKKIDKYRKSPQFKKLFDIADDVLPKLGLGNSETLNPVMVSYYDAVGFLPAALLNGLSRLGWSFDDKTENMSREFMIENFTLDRVVKSSAGLDPDKLLSYQEYWIAQCSLEEKVSRCISYLEQAGYINNEQCSENETKVERLLMALADRIKLFSDILSYEEYFVGDQELTFDEKAFEKRILKPERAVEILAAYCDHLLGIEDFSARSLEEDFKQYLEVNNLGYGDLIHSLRVATTGKGAGPGMFEALELLGQQSCVQRINRALDLVQKQ